VLLSSVESEQLEVPGEGRWTQHLTVTPLSSGQIGTDGKTTLLFNYLPVMYSSL
jgi:hypothetical protein